jgi:cephalosporin hydroxylase
VTLALPGMAQNEAEFATLLGLLKDLRPRSILEIGVWQGGTLARFAEAFPGAIVVGIDPAPQLPAVWPAEWGTILTGKSQNPSIRAQALARTPDGRYDVVHIDGDHGWQAVLSDWNWARGIAKQAVCLHDAANESLPGMDVWRVVNAIEANLDPLETDGSIERISLQKGEMGYAIVYL